ncbi:uncharacterized protein LOC142535149 [Primulina tabacum]|uniref:uncharacterized protein LOC142535149 n=1 Tax=Primulina tabacum TaxID=48773 RepID=UPI003F595AF6
MSSPTEINRVDFLYKKRKMQAEPVGVPRPKHVRWSQVLEYIDPSSDPIVDPKKMGGEYIRYSNLDSTMLTCNEDKTDPGYSKTRASNEPGSAFSGSIEYRSVTKPTSSESVTLSDHEAELLGFGSLSELGYPDYADYKELEYLLLSSGIDPSDYILSSGDRDGGKKLTIDEEFEECFSMLML